MLLCADSACSARRHLSTTGPLVDQLLLQLNVDEAELERRRAGWTKPEPRYRNGILGKYARLVSSSSRGATTDHCD